MKKIILSMLLAIMAGFAAFGFAACGDKTGDSSSTLQNGVEVSFPEVDGIVFVTDDLVNGQIEKGSTLTFTLDLSAWKGSKNFTLLAGDQPITPNEQGTYTVTVNEALTLRFADVTVSFNEAEGVSYVCEYQDTVTVPFNTPISFSLDVNPFYTAKNAVVRAGASIQAADAQGVYTVYATSDTVISVLDVVKDEATCTTGGTDSENPFLIYTPADWLFIAEQVKIGNVNYVEGYYQLEADLDFKGEMIPVIGDATTVGADNVETYFGGYFNGMGHTIKNFKIEETNTPYVGLFGYMMGSLNDPSLGTLNNVHIENFTVSGVMEGDANKMLAVGGLVGYGIGIRIINCSINGGQVSATGNEMYLSYVGGAIGVVQSAFLDFGSYQSRVTTEIAYVSVTDTTVFANDGIIPSAGGIAGYVFAADYLATTILHTSYARDVLVYGAIQTGGVVGHLAAYASVFNSYATGTVSAIAEIDDTSMPEYCTAYAGGVVAYAENETAIVRCFSASTLDASSAVDGYAFTDGIVAKMDDAGTLSPEAIVAYTADNYYAEGGVDGSMDFSTEEFLYNTLGWYAFDWIYEDGESYPSFYLNYDDKYEDGFNTTFVYKGATRSGQTSYTVNITEYGSLSFAIISTEVLVSEYMTGDNGAISYGFFLDEACTQRAPYAYLFMQLEQTIYVGFVDYSAVAGTYEMVVRAGDTASLTLNEDGSYEYEDGGIVSGGLYRYDGNSIVFNSARFARYANGGTISDIYQLDFYTFQADIVADGLRIYDGTYFTKANPLTALSSFGFEQEYSYNGNSYSFAKDWTVKIGNRSYTYTLNNGTITISNGDTGTYENGVLTLNGTAATALDAFHGVWTVSVSESYQLTMDGLGMWKLEQLYYDRNGGNHAPITTSTGTYTIDEHGRAVLTAGSELIGYVVMDSNGFLSLEGDGISITLADQNSYKGTWSAAHKNGSAKLTLNGITVDGSGMGSIEYWDGNTYELFYAMEYGRITLYNGAIVFGYMSYDKQNGTLVAYLYDSNQSMIDETNAYVFYHYDVFIGEWVGEHEELGEVIFNGFGVYTAEGFTGYVTIDDETTPYTLATNGDILSGAFTYNGKTYTIRYTTADGSMVIEDGSDEEVYERKDDFASLEIVDLNGNSYAFDGRGNLSAGGKLTVKDANGGETVYNYKNANGETAVLLGSEAVATIRVENNNYVWTTATGKTLLYLNNPFVGTWAVSGSYTTRLTLLPMDLTGKMLGTFDGRSISATYDAETGTCTYGASYLIPLSGGDFAISSTATLGELYQLCTKMDDLVGTTWTYKSFTTTTFLFDGTGKSENQTNSVYSTARQVQGVSAATIFTYEYMAEHDVYRLYATVGDRTRIYLLEWTDVSAKGAYVNDEGTRAFTLTSIDELYMIQAVEKTSGNTFTFDGRYTSASNPGTITVTDKDGAVVTTYKYVLTNISMTLGRIEMTLTNDDDGKQYTAVFNMFDNPFSITLTPIG